MSSLDFYDSFFEVDEINDEKLGKIYYVRQTEMIDQNILNCCDFSNKEILEYEIINFRSIYFSCKNGHGFFGFTNKEDAQMAVDFREGLIVAAIMKYKNKNF